jgi:tetratricopeptide (TPR) repeat protein
MNRYISSPLRGAPWTAVAECNGDTALDGWAQVVGRRECSSFSTLPTNRLRPAVQRRCRRYTLPPQSKARPARPATTRRLFSLCALWLFFFANFASAQDFSKANEAYAAGDFAAAKKIYAEAAAQHPDENDWYNLGNACFRLGEMGQAALAYERALALAPGHPEAAENLRFLRQKSGARADARTWLESALNAVPPAAATWLAVAVAWLGFAWGGAALWRRTGAGGVMGGALLVILGTTYGAGLAWWRHERAREAMVVSAVAEAKSEPSAMAQSAGGLPAGSRVRIISTVSGWHFCQLPGDTRGWLPTSETEYILSRQP